MELLSLALILCAASFQEDLGPVPDSIGEQLPPVPVVEVGWSVSQADAVQKTVQDLSNRMFRASALGGGPTDWSGFADPPPPAESEGKRPLPADRRMGVLGYYLPGGKPRRFPLPGRRRSSIRVPHELIWYEILGERETLGSWLAEYSSWYAKEGREVITDVNEDGTKAKLKIECRPRVPRVNSAQTRTYYLHSRAINDRAGTVTGYFRKVGGVVFRSESAELNALDLGKIRRSIEGRKHTLSFVIRPRGLPDTVRFGLLQKIRQTANPALQQRDEETGAQHSLRTILPRWLLDSADALNDIDSLEAHFDGAEHPPRLPHVEARYKGAA